MPHAYHPTRNATSIAIDRWSPGPATHLARRLTRPGDASKRIIDEESCW